jgi:hypothetical protein
MFSFASGRFLPFPEVAMSETSYALTVLGIVAITALGVVLSLRVRRKGDDTRIDGKTVPVPRR